MQLKNIFNKIVTKNFTKILCRTIVYVNPTLLISGKFENGIPIGEFNIKSNNLIYTGPYMEENHPETRKIIASDWEYQGDVLRYCSEIIKSGNGETQYKCGLTEKGYYKQNYLKCGIKIFPDGTISDGFFTKQTKLYYEMYAGKIYKNGDIIRIWRLNEYPFVNIIKKSGNIFSGKYMINNNEISPLEGQLIVTNTIYNGRWNNANFFIGKVLLPGEKEWRKYEGYIM